MLRDVIAIVTYDEGKGKQQQRIVITGHNLETTVRRRMATLIPYGNIISITEQPQLELQAEAAAARAEKKRS